MFTSIPINVLTFTLLLTIISAQTTTPTPTPSDRDKSLTAAFLLCSAVSSATSTSCTTPSTIDACLTRLSPTLWTAYDAHHTATNISSTPLGPLLSDPRLKSCVCAQETLQQLARCVGCVRREAGVQTGVVDLFGVGWIAERVCGVVVPGFEIPQGGREMEGVVVLDELPLPSTTITTTTTTTTVTNSNVTTPRGGNQTDTTTGGGKNGTDTGLPHGGGNQTTTSVILPTSTGSNETVRTGTPTPTQPQDTPSASESSGAAVAAVGRVLRDVVGGPVGMAVVVAVGMVMM